MQIILPYLIDNLPILQILDLGIKIELKPKPLCSCLLVSSSPSTHTPHQHKFEICSKKNSATNMFRSSRQHSMCDLNKTRGSVGWVCAAHISFCFEETLYRTLQISVHLATRFQRRRFFRNQPISNKNFLWWPCLLMDQDEMNNLYRGPYINVSYQVSVLLANAVSEEKIFF